MSDVTKWFGPRLIGVLAVAVIAIALGLTVLRPGADEPPSRPALAERVPGAVLPLSASDVFPATGTDSRVPSTAVLERILTPLINTPALGPSVSVDVLDPLTGEHLLSSAQATPRIPASTAKLLTAAAALTALGPQTTLATSLVSGNGAGQVVLVGGGDVLLAKGAGDRDAVNGRAGLTTLARKSAKALKAEGRSSVRLTLDNTLFTGPSRAPGWSKSDVSNGFVAPVYPLEIDAGRITGDNYARRSDDPGLAAAKVFAGLLEAQGIEVRGDVRRGAAADGARVLGRVRSAPIGDQLEYALTESDNTVAEALARLVAADAGRPTSFAGAGEAVLAQVKKLGVPVVGAVLADASGLADGSRISALSLTELLALAASPDHPQLRPILSGLPVAAVSGTLYDRFDQRSQRAAAGVVRAKTGTLRGVSSLAGTVVDADGRLLVFAAMADKVRSTTPARKALDSLVSTLAACGCR